jgi:uncharacterized FAD-dependent dehydrogenase
MTKKIQFKLNFDESVDTYLNKNYPDICDYRILSKSLDARGAPRGKKPVFQYNLEIISANEKFSSFEESFKELPHFDKKPVFIGAGPASLFGALRLAEYGIPSVIIERGEEAKKRMLDIAKFWRYGKLNPESNVCYGEGGAGLFSDGKLITRVKSPYVKYVMNKFVEFGAPKETAYVSNPHLGSNKIRNIIYGIADHLRSVGCEIHYNTRVDEILYTDKKVKGVKLNNGTTIETDHVILAAGHSAKDIYYHLNDTGVDMKQKDFAVGVRVEHPRMVIDKLQHGKYHESEFLGSARYRLSYHNDDSAKGTYSFCMCPGGYVLSSGTEADGIVVNGMSNYSRSSRWSNSALVVTVNQGRDFETGNILSGLEFQHEIEQKAYNLSLKHATGRELPAMTVGEFLKGKIDPNVELPKTSSPSKIFKADLTEIFPKFITDHLKTALREFNSKMAGFTYDEALLIAPETRTSAPITIIRDKETLESTSHSGLYPCGEGAGYAGGITSAGVDGVKVVESILRSVYKNQL